MARRESQGMQVAMIIFVCVTLLLLGTTYWFWNSSQKLTAQVTELESEKSTSSQNLGNAVRESTALKGYLGFVETESFETVQASLDQDKVTLGQGLPEAQQNFRDIPRLLAEKNRDLRRQLAEGEAREKALTAERDRIRQEGMAVAGKAQAAESAAQKDLDQERQAYLEARTKQADALEKRFAKLQDEMKTTEEKTSEAVAKLASVEKDLKNKEIQLQRVKDELRNILEDAFDAPDGLVTSAVLETDTVWLNIGAADGLQAKMTFSVYDADTGTDDVSQAEPKASIEVTKVVGPHFAEARIVDMQHRDPIVPGDYVASPTWDPGKRVGFALLGRLDLNGDQSDDRELVRNLIEQNGGRIDAEDVDGKVRGEISVDTRYLVVGDTSVKEDSGKSNLAFGPMQAAADTFGVTRISLAELTRRLGYRGSLRAVSYQGDNASAGDFRAKPREGIVAPSPGSTSFDVRSPQEQRKQTSPPTTSRYYRPR